MKTAEERIKNAIFSTFVIENKDSWKHCWEKLEKELQSQSPCPAWPDKEEIKSIKDLIKIAERYEKQRQGLFDWEFESLRTVKKFLKSRLTNPATIGREKSICKSCGKEIYYDKEDGYWDHYDSETRTFTPLCDESGLKFHVRYKINKKNS